MSALAMAAAPGALPTLAGDVPVWAYTALPHAVVGLFVFALGACLGSFANVLVHRMPLGMSVVSPPSRCPVCGVRLRWHENLPILGWLRARGRCRTCGAPISPRYVAIEAICGCLLLWLYLCLYLPSPEASWWGAIGGGWWSRGGLLPTLPAFLLWSMLLVGLLAMARIDARAYIIPIEIPNALVAAAMLLWTVQALAPLPTRALDEPWPIPVPASALCWAALGAGLGALGLALALRARLVRPSFHDYDDYLPRPGEGDEELPEGPPIEWLFLAAVLVAVAVGAGRSGAGLWGWAAAALALACAAIPALSLRRGGEAAAVAEGVLAEYPHARREVLREALHLAPVILGGLIGWLAAGWLGPLATQGGRIDVAAAVGAALAGYLVGGGLVWGVRILGTLSFGREAMGLGDVHLLGAVGAVLGWQASVRAFVLAIVIALAWAILARALGGRGAVHRGGLPFGPHLAVGAVLAIGLQPGLAEVLGAWLRFVAGG